MVDSRKCNQTAVSQRQISVPPPVASPLGWSAGGTKSKFKPGPLDPLDATNHSGRTMTLELHSHTVFLRGALVANVFFAILTGTVRGQSPEIEFASKRVIGAASKKLDQPKVAKPANDTWTDDSGFVIISDEPASKQQPAAKQQPTTDTRVRGALNENKSRYSRPTEQILNLDDRRQGSLLGSMEDLSAKFNFPLLSGKRAKASPRGDKQSTSILAAMADRLGQTNPRSKVPPVRDPKVVPADFNNRSRQQAQPKFSRSPEKISANHNAEFATPKGLSQAAPKASERTAKVSKTSAAGGFFKQRQRLATEEQPALSANTYSKQVGDLQIPNDPSQARLIPATSKRNSKLPEFDALGGLFKRRQRPTAAGQSSLPPSPQQVSRLTSNQPPSAINSQPKNIQKKNFQHSTPQLQHSSKVQRSRKLQPAHAPNPSLATTASSRPVSKRHSKVTSLPTKRDKSLERVPRKTIGGATTPAQERVVALIIEIHGKAQTATSETDYTEVIESCRHALAIESKGERSDYAKKMAAWGLNRRGQVKADAGDSQQALLDFEDALRLDPTLWRAFHNRGVLRAQAGEFEQAFNDFMRCTELNPRFAKAYSNRAALFVQAGDLQSAMQDYRRAIEFDPELCVAHQGRGRVCHMLGRLQEALYHFDAAAQLLANDSHVITSRADLLADIGRYAEAANEYKRAIELDDQLAHAYRSSAWLLATCPDDSIRNSNMALEQAQQAIRLSNSKTAISLDTLAAAQANAGDFPSAIASLEQAVEISRDQERATYEIRLEMYRSFQPFRTSPMTAIQPANYTE